MRYENNLCFSMISYEYQNVHGLFTWVCVCTAAAVPGTWVHVLLLCAQLPYLGYRQQYVVLGLLGTTGCVLCFVLSSYINVSGVYLVL